MRVLKKIEKQRQRQREKERQRDSDKQRERQREKKRQRQREKGRETERDREVVEWDVHNPAPSTSFRSKNNFWIISDCKSSFNGKLKNFQ